VHVNPGLISVVFIALTALIAGMLFTRIRQPALVGYILTGLVLGQSGFGLIENRESIHFLAELGMLLLLFFVGMHLSLRGFRAVWLVATMTALLQIAAALAVMWLISGLIGWSIATAVLFGFVAAVSSTAVAIKMLQDLNILQTQVGQLSVSILIAQDLAIVPILLIIAALGGEGFQVASMLNLVLSILFLALLVWYLSRRTRVRLPFSGILARSSELQPLFGLVICFGSAFITAMLGLTSAYGAFLAGLVVGNSSVRRIIQRSVQPVQSILIMMFFVSVGLLIDLEFVWANIGLVLLITFIVTVVKTALNIGILTLLREPWPHAFISGVMLAQIGEFSFLLGGVGRSLGIIRPEEFQLIVTVAAFSLMISPFWLLTARRLLRIALTGAVSTKDVFVQIKEGGARAFWRATRGREVPLQLALRILGRPKRSTPSHHSGDD
jgi:CPA2 family monovalent cation:H+ antiporter-2